MIYGIAHFKKELPNFTGFQLIASFDNYSIFSMTDESVESFPASIKYEQITELEGTTAWRFYGENRSYRSAYSDVEGLEPDADALAQGKRKTKVYYTPEITQSVVTLMKRILKGNINDVYALREDKTGQEDLLTFVESLNTISEITYHKERLLGTEMGKTQLSSLYMWDEDSNSRIGRHYYQLGF